MKKTLLSILAMMAVVNAASALPTPDDRKALCDKHPDKYVWVEKTKSCIPINPCKSNDEQIVRSYCPLATDTGIFSKGEKFNLVIERFIQVVFNSTVAHIADLPQDPSYVAVWTMDGYYFVVPTKGGALGLGPERVVSEYILDAMEAMNLQTWLMTGDAESKTVEIEGNMTKAMCQDIADFASLLADELITAQFSVPNTTKNLCVLKW